MGGRYIIGTISMMARRAALISETKVELDDFLMEIKAFDGITLTLDEMPYEAGTVGIKAFDNITLGLEEMPYEAATIEIKAFDNITLTLEEVAA